MPGDILLEGGAAFGGRMAEPDRAAIHALAPRLFGRIGLVQQRFDAFP